MNYGAKTPNEYFEKLEPDWRKEKLEQVRHMIMFSDPSLIEGMEYKMLSYGTEEEIIFHLNAQSAYVSLYVGNIEKAENAQGLLKDFDTGKGCIRIKKKNELDKTKLGEFINRVIEICKKGGNVDC